MLYILIIVIEKFFNIVKIVRKFVEKIEKGNTLTRYKNIGMTKQI